MDSTIIAFPQTDVTDPVLERALFFAELEHLELRATIPQVDPTPIEDAKTVY